MSEFSQPTPEELEDIFRPGDTAIEMTGKLLIRKIVSLIELGIRNDVIKLSDIEKELPRLRGAGL